MESRMESLYKRLRTLWYRLPPSPRHFTFPHDEKDVRISLERGRHTLLHTTNKVRHWNRKKATMLLVLVIAACVLQLRVALLRSSTDEEQVIDELLFLQMSDQPSSMLYLTSSWVCNEQLDWNLETQPPGSDLPALRSAKRRQQCEVRNLCVDAQGAFVLSSKDVPPPINLIAADQASDKYFQPRRVTPKKSLKAHFVNETLFVYGHYSPSQFSHWLYNGVMPLQSTMRRFRGTKHSWLLRQTTFDDIQPQKDWEQDNTLPPTYITESGRRVFEKNRELVLHPEEITSEFQTLPPRDAPICFERAVIGLGSQCPFHYCEQNIPSSLYTDYSTSVSQYYWPTRARWIEYLLTKHYGIEEWKESIGWGRYEEHNIDSLGVQEEINAARFLERNEGTPLQCLWNAKYFNFEEDPYRDYRMWVDPLLRHSQEPPSRFGIADPDRRYRKQQAQEDEEGEEEEASRESIITKRKKSPSSDNIRRKIVIAIVQREKSRTLINVDELTQRLVSEGYRVKRLTFDHGCGIPATAYLLRDVDLMITPYGNALGTSIFLPRRPHVTTVSVDTSYAPENRFIWTTAAIGQRYLQHHFGPDFQTVAQQNVERAQKANEGATILTNSTMDQLVAVELARLQTRYPPVRDMKLVRKIRDQLWGQPGHKYEKVAAKLKDDEDLRQLLLATREKPKEDSKLVRRLGGVEVLDAFLVEYWRASARYVNVDYMSRVAAIVDKESRQLARGRLLGESDKVNGKQQQRVPYSYLDLCRENRCCGHACESILRRTLVGDHAALGMHAQPGGQWGFYHGSDNVLRPQKTAQDKASEYGPGQLLDWKLEL